MQEILDNAQIFNGVDTSSLCDDTRHLKRRPAWKVDTLNPLQIKPQSDLIVTHVNQAHELERVKALTAIPSDLQTTEEWLGNHSLEYQGLTLKDLLDKGRQVKRPGQDKHMVFSGPVITEMEYKLNTAIEVYHNRVRWLLDGTRKTFGMIRGDRVGILIDASDANMGFGRLKQFQNSLLDLVDEQLCSRRSLYFMTFGTELDCLWNVARDVNTRILEEARDFIRQMRPSGGCNLMKAFKKIMNVKRLDSILIILGSCPDQTSNVLYDYVEQCLLGKNVPIQAIAYDTSSHQGHTALQKLAEVSRGRYQCYSSSDVKESYKSSDVRLLLQESQRTLDMLSKIKQMRTGMLGNALVSIENEIALQVEHMTLSRFMPRPMNHLKALSIENPNFHPASSLQWLADNGLMAKRLNLYQVLAPDAFDPVRDFVPILQKSVKSKVNETAMQQFEWHDGSVKNMHVDVAMLYDYQKKLGNAVQTFEARIEWLASDSRRIWGTICEKRVVLLIDTSVVNKSYLVHLQHSIRMVLEEQMANKEAFNIIAFGSHPKMWKPHMVKPTPENLQAAWRWTLHMEASGSRNLIGALRVAIENTEDVEKYGGVQGLYCIGSGIPDQQEDVACTFINEKCTGCDLRCHMILFCIEAYLNESEFPSRYADVNQTADYLRNMAHCGRGRFHWFRESGIIESDDVGAIMQEMERAVYYSQRCASLVNAVKAKGDKSEERKAIQPLLTDKLIMLPPPENPRQTALSLARAKQAIRGELQKPLAWRPTSNKATLPAAPYEDDRDVKAKKHVCKPKPRVEPFYTEEGSKVGTIYKKFPKKRSVRKCMPEVILPEIEERLSSKRWLKKYGINKLKLNLNRYVSGPICVHEKSKVRSTGRHVHAKWFCSIFPSIEVNGKVRHIDMSIKELDDYNAILSRVASRYLQRIQWLLSGTRKMFGVIMESNIILLIDVSGSMDDQLDALKNEMTKLIWELHQAEISFNIIAFSENISAWQEHVTESTEASCQDAILWLSALRAHGGTRTLEALEEALGDKRADGIYLLSDGKPDSSIKLTLEVAKQANNKGIPINAISFNGSDAGHILFMKSLASQSGGRYHYCSGVKEGHLVAYELMSDGFLDEDDHNLPDFQGDDLGLLRAEVAKARKYIAQAKLYKNVVEQHKAELQLGMPEVHVESKSVDRPFLP